MLNPQCVMRMVASLLEKMIDMGAMDPLDSTANTQAPTIGDEPPRCSVTAIEEDADRGSIATRSEGLTAMLRREKLKGFNLIATTSKLPVNSEGVGIVEEYPLMSLATLSAPYPIRWLRHCSPLVSKSKPNLTAAALESSSPGGSQIWEIRTRVVVSGGGLGRRCVGGGGGAWQGHRRPAEKTDLRE
nr:hypothetical protein Iba_chr10dCG10960 [Ipomoea batatas]